MIPCQFEKLKCCLQKYKINVIDNPQNILKVNLHNTMDSISMDEIVEVFLITDITNAEKKLVYIGMKKRKFEQHLNEDISDIQLDRPCIQYCD